MILDSETDATLRKYARRLDPDNGEDGYHNAVASLLKQKFEPNNLIGLLKKKTKWAIFKIWEHERVEQKCVEANHNGEKSSSDNLHPPPFRTHCARGHEMAGDNIYWNKTRRVCKACRRIREKQHRRIRQ
jgi:hypothetical protein